MQLTKLESQVFKALQKNGENSQTVEGTIWWTVYLPNAKPKSMSAHQFAAILSNLEQKGLYQKNLYEFEGYFGLVRPSSH